MTGRLAALALVFALLGACGARTSGNAQQASPPPSGNTLPAAPAGNSAATVTGGIDRQWLVGSWQADNPQCAGDGFFTLDADGGYGFMAEEGRWTLAGDALTIEITAGGEDGGSRPGDRHTARVRMVGPDEAEFTPERGPVTHVYRCREAGR